METAEGIGLRKRARSDPDDCEECMPISKRINNLHIRQLTESWEQLECQTGEGFNNNIPSEAACCQMAPHIPASPHNALSPQQCHLIGHAMPTPRIANIPGSALGPLPLYYQQSHMLSDINHNNPLLSPMPRQPCPSSVLITQQTCQNCSNYRNGSSMSNNENPHYVDINSTLFQAHMYRISRLRQGGDANT